MGEAASELVNKLRKDGRFGYSSGDLHSSVGFIDRIGIESKLHSGLLASASQARHRNYRWTKYCPTPTQPSGRTPAWSTWPGLVFHTEFELPVTFGTGFVDILSDSQAIDRARDRMVGNAVKARPVEAQAQGRWTRSRNPPATERGAFAYFLRFAHRVGFHAWAQPDGQGVLLGNRTTTRTPSVNWSTCAAVRVVPTPSSAPASPAITPQCRRTSTSTARQQTWGQDSVIGYAVSEGAPFFKLFYITDDESDDRDHADAYAIYMLGKDAAPGVRLPNHSARVQRPGDRRHLQRGHRAQRA